MIGPAPTTCSKLSSTSRTRRADSHSSSDSAIGFLPASVIPTAAAIRGATSIWSRIGSSGTKKTPSGKVSATDVASWSESRVFPVPPGPVIVSSRVVSNRRLASASSSSRPTKVVSWVGRLFGRVSGVRSFGNSEGSPSPSTWKSRSGASRSRSRYSPSSRRVTPGGRALATRARVASEATICPP